MSCTISIDEVAGHVDSDGDVTDVRVIGTAEECARIELTLRCRDRRLGATLESSFLVDVTPGEARWEAVVTTPDCAACGRLLTVEAYCLLEGDVRHPDCDPAVVTAPLVCGECPGVRVETSVDDKCTSGRRGVTYKVFIDSPPGEIVETHLHYGDGTSSSPTVEHRYTRTRMYETESTVRVVNPWVEIVRPEGCASAELPPVNIPSCPEEERGPRCPAVNGVTAGAVRATRQGCELVWSAHLTSAPRPGTYTWEFDDGEVVTTDVPFVRRTYGESGSYWVKVSYQPNDPECPKSRWTGSKELEGCEPGSGGEGGGCIILRDIATFALAIAAALAVVLTCVTDPSRSSAIGFTIGALTVAGLLILTLWLIFCPGKPCKPGLLLTGLAVLGGGYALLHLAGCCAALTAAAPATIAAGGAILVGWKTTCDESWCRLWQEVTVFQAGPLTVFIAAIAVFLQPCLPTFGEEAIATTLMLGFDLAFAGVAMRAFTCDGLLEDAAERKIPRARDVEEPLIDESDEEGGNEE